MSRQCRYYKSKYLEDQNYQMMFQKLMEYKQPKRPKSKAKQLKDGALQERGMGHKHTLHKGGGGPLILKTAKGWVTVFLLD